MKNKNKEIAKLNLTAFDTGTGVRVHIEFGGDTYKLVKVAMERNEELAEDIMLAVHDYLKEKQTDDLDELELDENDN